MSAMENPAWTNKEGWARGDDAEKEENRRMGELLEPVLRAGRIEFKQLLEEEGRISETFPIRPDGSLDITGSRHDGLINLAVPVNLARTAAEDPRYTPDAVRTAAAQCINEHPDTILSFSEDRIHQTFSYTATLKKPETPTP